MKNTWTGAEALKPNLEICKKCEHLDYREGVPTIYQCRLRIIDYCRDIISEQTLWYDYTFPSNCPYLLEHTVTLEVPADCPYGLEMVVS